MDLLLRYSRMSSDQFLEDIVQAACDRPLRIMALKPTKVRDITDVIADTVFFLIRPIEFLTAYLLYAVDSLTDGKAIRSAPADIIHLAAARIQKEFM